MKQRQERQNLLTPQLQNAQSLPMLSPQQSMQQPQGSQQQPQQPFGQTPATPQQQQQQQRGSQQGQQGIPPGLRSAQMQNQQLPNAQQPQQPQQQQQPTPVMQNPAPMQVAGASGQQPARGSNIADVVASWNNEQLMRNTTGILSRIQESNPSVRCHRLI